MKISKKERILPLSHKTFESLCQKHSKASRALEKVQYEVLYSRRSTSSCLWKYKLRNGKKRYKRQEEQQILQEWTQMDGTVFGNVKEAFRNSIHEMTIRYSTFWACRVIPLDKQPGIRPVVTDEVLRKAIAMIVMKFLRKDTLKATESW